MQTPGTKTVRFIQSFATERDTFVGHREYELPEAEADGYIAAGLARDVTPTPAVEKKSRQQMTEVAK